MVLKSSSAEMQAPGRSPGMIPGFFPLPLLNRGCSETKNILGWWRGRNLAGLFQAPSHSLKQLRAPPGACCLRARSQGMVFIGKGELSLPLEEQDFSKGRHVQKDLLSLSPGEQQGSSSEFLVSSEPVKFDSLHCFKFLAAVAMGFSLLPGVPAAVGWVTLRRDVVSSFYFGVGTAFAPQAAGFGSSWSLSEGTSSLGAH